MYCPPVTDLDDHEPGGEAPVLDWEAARFLFWPVLILGVALAVLSVAIDGLLIFAVGSVVSFQVAWSIVRSSGRLKGREPIARIGSIILGLAWVVVFVKFAIARGWF